MSVTVAFSTVLIMLLYALPGFLLIKTKLTTKENIPAFSRLLMYVCQPALVITSMSKVTASAGMSRDLLIVFSVMLLSQGGMIGLLYLLFRKKTDRAEYRIYVLASACGNCSFMGIPVLEALLPDHPEAVAFSAVASLALNIIGWTVGSAVIMRDKKYISAKKILFNPTTLAMYVAIPLYLTGSSLPSALSDAVGLVGKMSTPLCMIVMGMRLATVPFKSVFLKAPNYAVIAVKQIVFPASVLGVLMLLPINNVIRSACYIMLCCPSASVVLNFSEMLGKGQKTAAAIVLLSTLFSILTIPLMILLI